MRTSTLSIYILTLVLAIANGCGDDDATLGDTTEVDTSVGDTTEDTVIDDTVEDTDVEDTTVTCPLNTACDDGNPCTSADKCDAAGVCAGSGNACDDGLTCTTDTCDDAGGCTSTLLQGFCMSGNDDAIVCVADTQPVPGNSCQICDTSGDAPMFTALADGMACSDGDACTTQETCNAGVCVAAGALDCAVDNVCLAGSCDPMLGCVTSNTTTSCDDADPCSIGDTCAEGTCGAGSETPDCADEDPCTVDSCAPGEGCVHDPTALCDDEDPCTADSCAAGVCTNTAIPMGDACDDGNPCTLDETCNNVGVCTGGAVNACNDDNDCTLDSCNALAGGCLNLFIDDPCDDGAVCTTADRCVAGECFGAKSADCPRCAILGTDHANKLVSMEMVSDGNPGSGLDVDGDPNTCSPDGACGGGVDNALGVVAFAVNEGLVGSIQGGIVNWVIDLKDLTFDGEPFEMPIYDTGLSVLSESLDCDALTQTCEYRVAQLSLDQDCEPYFAFDNATAENGVILAGGTDSLISMVLPLADGELLSITVAWARVEATYTLGSDGKIASMQGILAGAVPKAQLLDAVNGLSSDVFPVPQAVVVSVLTSLDNDIDLDGDGLKESISVSLRFGTIPALIQDQPLPPTP
ncbi:MAG: hypothetical protein ACI9MR_001621 [Myxococcota bacterium]|jgi:hypothetical protein